MAFTETMFSRAGGFLVSLLHPITQSHTHAGGFLVLSREPVGRPDHELRRQVAVSIGSSRHLDMGGGRHKVTPPCVNTNLMQVHLI